MQETYVYYPKQRIEAETTTNKYMTAKKKEAFKPQIITLKQDRAAKIMAKSIVGQENKSKKQILKEAGYSKTGQLAPSKVTNTAGFQAALEKYLPHDFLVENHNDLISQRDNIPSAVKALDLAYEVKGMKSDKGSMGFAQFLQVINVNKDTGTNTHNSSTNSSEGACDSEVIDVD